MEFNRLYIVVWIELHFERIQNICNLALIVQYAMLNPAASESVA